MEHSFLKVRVSPDLYKRYRILCIKKDLSLQHQTVALIKNFVVIQEDNDNKIESALRNNK